MGILVSHWRRGAIGLLALVAAAAALTQMRPAATSDGNPYSVPLLEDTNPDPKIFEATIIAMPAAVDVGRGLTASVLTFNGTVPGPELRMKVGDTVIIHFKNQIAHNTGIHWHGIELANASDGTPLTQNQVPPNGEFLYKFTVNRPGIYWYHPHHHSSTNQVFKGLYGSLIVTDPNEAALQASGVIPAAVDTRTVVFSDVTVCKAQGSNDMLTYDLSLPHVSGAPLEAQGAPFPVTICETNPLDEDGEPRAPYNAGDVPNIQLGGNSGTVNEGQTVLTNGMNVGGRGGSPALPGVLAEGAYTLPVKAGQGLRLQMINAATTRFFRLRLTDANGTQIPLVRIGGQGGHLDNARVEGNGVVPVPAGTFDFKYDTGEILLDPGDRADVAVAIPATAAGVLTMWTEDFQRSGSGSGYMRLPTPAGGRPGGCALHDRSRRGAACSHRRPRSHGRSRHGGPAQSRRVLAGKARTGQPGHSAHQRRQPARRQRPSGVARLLRRLLGDPARELGALREARRHARTAGDEQDQRPPPVPPARLLDPANRAV
jgi:FtsP/CotA-like multicopper oxidase with cupredoxin domain